MCRRFHILCLFLTMVTTTVSAQVLDKVVAEVNDNVITETELNEQVDVLRKQLQARQVEIPSQDILRKQVLQHLIDVELQLQLAKNNGVTVDNADLDQAIEKIANSNHLSLEQLRIELEKQGLTWTQYRENIRKEMLMSRIQQKAVGQEVVVTPQQVEDYLKTAKINFENQKFHIQNIVIPLPESPTTDQLTKAQKKAEQLLAKIHAGEDFSRSAIAESSDEYALEGGDLGERSLVELPEVFAKKVIQMKPGEVQGPLRAPNGLQLIKLVNVKGEEMHHQVTKTHVRHILIKPDVSMTVEEALKQIHNIYQQLIAGKDFATMAKQYSLDGASAIKGGDLGWVTAEELVPTFAEAMQALQPHHISKPVHSPFGWHIIEVLERKTIDDSAAYKKQKVTQYLQQRKFQEAVQNWQQHSRLNAYIHIIDKDLV